MSFANPTTAPLARAFLDRLPPGPVPGKQLHRTDSGSVLGDWFGFALSTAFQPIVDSNNGQIVGREALLRSDSADEQGGSPWTLFSGLSRAGNEWLCTDCVVHCWAFVGATSVALSRQNQGRSRVFPPRATEVAST